MKVVKKDQTLEDFNENKIRIACNKSANRAMVSLSEKDHQNICKEITRHIDSDAVTVEQMHYLVENALTKLFPEVAKQYKDYRNYKQEFPKILDGVLKKKQSLKYIGDKSNANTDSALVPTQRSLVYNEFNDQIYKKIFLNPEEREAAKDGYIYIHDRSARLDTINCCLFNISKVLEGGFEMANVWYNEPKSLDVAFDVISDVAMSAAACQYGGFTLPEIDSVLAPYAEKSYQKYRDEYKKIKKKNLFIKTKTYEKAIDDYAFKKVKRDFEQGFQSWEYRFNTVGSSRGDYPFVAISYGINKTRWGQLATSIVHKVRKNGQGKDKHKKCVLFPKMTFLYDESMHGKGAPFEKSFLEAVECSKKAMYPDFLSLTGEGYIPSMYKQYGKAISLMG